MSDGGTLHLIGGAEGPPDGALTAGDSVLFMTPRALAGCLDSLAVAAAARVAVLEGVVDDGQCPAVPRIDEAECVDWCADCDRVISW